MSCRKLDMSVASVGQQISKLVESALEYSPGKLKHIYSTSPPLATQLLAKENIAV